MKQLESVRNVKLFFGKAIVMTAGTTTGCWCTEGATLGGTAVDSLRYSENSQSEIICF